MRWGECSFISWSYLALVYTAAFVPDEGESLLDLGEGYQPPAALPHLLVRGTIVSTCSANAVLPDPLVIDYSAAKAALLNFSKSLSKEVGPRGVRVNTVSPGPVSTPLWLGDDGVAASVASASNTEAVDVAKQAASEAVTGRFTRPEEVADLILLLSSDRAGNVTGSDFVIDGGLITTV